MQGDGLIHDRTGTAVTIAIIGSACGGSMVGTAMVGFGFAPADRPLFLAVAGALTIIVTTLLAGWYLPTAGEIARQWTEKEGK